MIVVRLPAPIALAAVESLHLSLRTALFRNAISAFRPSIIRANSLVRLLGGRRLYFAKRSASASCKARRSFRVLSIKSSISSHWGAQDGGVPVPFVGGNFVTFIQQ